MRLNGLIVIAISGLLVGTASAQGPSKSPAIPIPFSITGPNHDLTNVVVRVPLPKTVSTTPILQWISDKQGDNTKLPFQASPANLLATHGSTYEITLLLNSLKANETKTLVYKYVPSSVPAPIVPPYDLIPDVHVQSFRWLNLSQEHIDLSWHSAGGKDFPLLRYMFTSLDESSKDRRSETFKPYHHFFALDGQTLLTKGPGGLYPHHRGLFFGFNKVTYGDGRKADVWHCTGDAYQSHEEFEQTLAGGAFGRQRVRINWHGEKKEVFAEEERELTVYAPHDKGMLIEFASIVRPKVDNVRLDGDPQHSGFHFRANNEVADQFNAKKPETYFLRPDGKGKIGEERNWDPKTKKGPVNLPWDAMSFTVAGKRYTALYLDHPDNPKEARGSERVYGRIGSYFEYNLTKDKPLRVQYRIWIQEGEMTVEQCEAMSRAFTEPVKVELK